MRRLAALAIAAGVALILVAGGRSATRLPLFELAAAQLTGGPVAVLCENPVEHAADAFGAALEARVPGAPPLWGYTWPVARRTVLSPLECGYLMLLSLDPSDRRGSLLNGPQTTMLEGEALYIFAHELGLSAGGNGDEGAAECFALDRFPELAAAFGIPPARERTLIAYGRAIHDAAPPAYRTECP